MILLNDKFNVFKRNLDLMKVKVEKSRHFVFPSVIIDFLFCNLICHGSIILLYLPSNPLYSTIIALHYFKRLMHLSDSRVCWHVVNKVNNLKAFVSTTTNKHYHKEYRWYDIHDIIVLHCYEYYVRVFQVHSIKRWIISI